MTTPTISCSSQTPLPPGPEAVEAGPGGDVRRGDPAGVDLLGLRAAARAHGLRGADAGGLHDGVLAVRHG